MHAIRSRSVCLTYLFRLCFTGYFQIFVSPETFWIKLDFNLFAFWFDCVLYIQEKNTKTTLNCDLHTISSIHLQISAAFISGSQMLGCTCHGTCSFDNFFTLRPPPGNRGVPCWPYDIGPQTGLTFLLLQSGLSFVQSSSPICMISERI